MNRLFLLFFLFIGLLSCQQYSIEFNTIEKENFNISLPDYMEKCKDMVEEGNAPVQYCNRFRNLYMVVFEDEKDISFEDYQRKGANVIKINSGMTDVKITDSIYAENNGYKMIQLKIYGLMGKDNDMFYTHRTYEGKKMFYQVCIWTRGKKRKLAYQEDVEKMLSSFIIK